MKFTLVSFILCPYAQRISIALTEKEMEFQQVNIDLSDKPDWFKLISPLGKVPLLRIEKKGQQAVIFESSAILEYLEDIGENPLFSKDPLQRAQERSWIEFGSSVLNDIGGLYSAKTEDELSLKLIHLSQKFDRLEQTLSGGSWFSGHHFGLVDVVFGPIFRYFDVFDRIEDFGLFRNRNKLKDWRTELSNRRSIQNAVTADYPELLIDFLQKKESALRDRI